MIDFSGEVAGGVARVGIAGFGTVGRAVAEGLARLSHARLMAVAGRDVGKTRAEVAEMGLDVRICKVAELPELADLVVDCAPTAAFPAVAEATLAAGRTLVTINGAAILEYPDLGEKARRGGGRVVLATGALLGLDGIRAAAMGNIESVAMVTRKPPRSLEKASYVRNRGISLIGIERPLQLFSGRVRDAARLFPANVNVAAAVALAGIGPDRTTIEIWADPAKQFNTHTVRVVADSARFSFTIENVPTVENPGTGRITALSILAALDGVANPFRVGS